jgi:WD40 repeat protein
MDFQLSVALTAHEGEVWIARWSHNGHFIASDGTDKRVLVWDVGVRTLQPIFAHLIDAST